MPALADQRGFGGGFIGGGFGVAGSFEGIAIASTLNALTIQAEVKTIVRVQGSSCELFLLCTPATSEKLRIKLSGPLAIIGETASAASQRSSAGRSLS